MLAAILGWGYAYLGYSLRHMQFNLSGFDVFLNKLTATAEIATLAVPRCGSAPDYQHIGDQRREAMMLYVATIVDLYKTTFGKPPDSIDDLDKLPNFDNADKLNGRQVKKSCSIRMYPIGSYVLACGASLPPPKEIDAFLGKARRVQGFYMLGAMEALYIPEGGCSVAPPR
jgi:hypothetical protein